MEYKIGDEVISQKDQLLTLTNVEAERMVDDGIGGKRRLLSVGTFGRLADVVERAGGPGAAVVRLEIAPEERLARWIEMFSVLLLAGGILGLYVEFKSPGFGFPGVAGILLLAVWFWGHHVAGLAGSGELILFVAGVLLLAVEIFFIPGFGIVGMTGILLVVLSLLLAMVQRPPGMPSFSMPLSQLVQAAQNLGFALALSLAGGLVLARTLPRTEAYRHLVLARDVAASHGFTAAPPADSLIGLKGKAVTKLRPGGIAEIGGRRLDVVTRGTFVEPGAPIRVAEAHGNRIVVETEEIQGPGPTAAA
jgi:membrane-bound serine protease (ClpP class)